MYARLVGSVPLSRKRTVYDTAFRSFEFSDNALAFVRFEAVYDLLERRSELMFRRTFARIRVTVLHIRRIRNVPRL